jgi:hypothetical protein
VVVQAQGGRGMMKSVIVRAVEMVRAMEGLKSAGMARWRQGNAVGLMFAWRVVV